MFFFLFLEGQRYQSQITDMADRSFRAYYSEDLIETDTVVVAGYLILRCLPPIPFITVLTFVGN